MFTPSRDRRDTKSRGAGYEPASLPVCRRENQLATILPQGEAQDLREAATHSLKSMGSLLENPPHYSSIVVAETQVVIQGREAMLLAISSNCETF